jgi:hypothetical protein
MIHRVWSVEESQCAGTPYQTTPCSIVTLIEAKSRVAANAPDIPPLPASRNYIESNDFLSLSSTHTSQLARVCSIPTLP